MTAPVIPQPRTPDPAETLPEEAPVLIAAEHMEMWALIQRAQAGDAAAFGEIYDRYADTVFRFIYFRVGNRPLAEDLAGDVWLRTLKRIGSFAYEGRDFGAWLITIARNLVVDHFKSGKYRLEITTGDVLDADRQDHDRYNQPEDAAISYLSSIELNAAIKKLGPDQQECIVLRHIYGYSVAETAVLMQRNEGAIKALCYRAIRSLARILPPSALGGEAHVSTVVPKSTRS